MMVVKRWFIAEWYRSLANGKKETHTFSGENLINQTSRRYKDEATT